MEHHQAEAVEHCIEEVVAQEYQLVVVEVADHIAARSRTDQEEPVEVVLDRRPLGRRLGGLHIHSSDRQGVEVVELVAAMAHHRCLEHHCSRRSCRRLCSEPMVLHLVRCLCRRNCPVDGHVVAMALLHQIAAGVPMDESRRHHKNHLDHIHLVQLQYDLQHHWKDCQKVLA